jgi:hypothetical protein
VNQGKNVGKDCERKGRIKGWSPGAGERVEIGVRQIKKRWLCALQARRVGWLEESTQGVNGRWREVELGQVVRWTVEEATQARLITSEATRWYLVSLVILLRRN